MAPIRTLLLASVSLLASTALAASAVLDLLPSNFDSIVLDPSTPRPALVEFFAPWCGHCKTLAPIYEELGTAFLPLASKVTIARVDADAEKSLGKRFGVQGFPTLKWFDGVSAKPVDYEGPRDLESLTKFVEGKLGMKIKKAKAATSAVIMLTDDSFTKHVGAADSAVLVAFTAPWCGHCKTLAPVWETLAQSMSREPGVVIAKVDAEAENARATAQKQGVTGFPTIKYYPQGSSEAVAYDGARTEAAFIEFLNDNTGTYRTVGGGLNAQAGTIGALDALVRSFVAGSTTLVSVTEQATKLAKTVTDTGAAYYLRVLAKLAANEQFAKKELRRLEGIVTKGGLAPSKVDELTRKINVLRSFSGDLIKGAGEAVKSAGEKVKSSSAGSDEL